MSTFNGSVSPLLSTKTRIEVKWVHFGVQKAAALLGVPRSAARGRCEPTFSGGSTGSSRSNLLQSLHKSWDDGIQRRFEGKSSRSVAPWCELSIKRAVCDQCPGRQPVNELGRRTRFMFCRCDAKRSGLWSSSFKAAKLTGIEMKNHRVGCKSICPLDNLCLLLSGVLAA